MSNFDGRASQPDLLEAKGTGSRACSRRSEQHPMVCLVSIKIYRTRTFVESVLLRVVLRDELCRCGSLEDLKGRSFKAAQQALVRSCGLTLLGAVLAGPGVPLTGEGP